MTDEQDDVKPSRLVVTIPMRLQNPMNGAFGASRGAIMSRAKSRRVQRYAARLAVSAQLGFRKWVEFPVAVRITRIATRKLDAHDGLPAACKSVVDGIADALGVDDGDETRVTWTYAQETARTYGVRIEIGGMGA